MKFRCGICKGITFSSLLISTEKANEEILVKFAKHIGNSHPTEAAVLGVQQQRIAGLVGTILLADQLEDTGDADNARLNDAIEKGIDTVMELIGVDKEEDQDKPTEPEKDQQSSPKPVEQQPTKLVT